MLHLIGCSLENNTHPGQISIFQNVSQLSNVNLKPNAYIKLNACFSGSGGWQHSIPGGIANAWVEQPSHSMDQPSSIVVPTLFGDQGDYTHLTLDHFICSRTVEPV